MKLYPLTPSTRPFSRLFLASALLITAVSTSARGQIGGIDPDPGDKGTGGKNTIQGTIFLPGGQKPNKRIKVTLKSFSSGDLFIMSDDSGVFSFRRLQGGTYTLVVDAGVEYDVATETVDVIEPAVRRQTSGIVVPVYITLQPRGSRSGSTGTVDARTAAIPESARDLYKQAIESEKAGDRNKAIEQLEAALTIFPNFVAALNQLGVQYIALKKWDKASEVLGKAIGIAPDAFHPRLNYGIVLIQTKNYKGAVDELNIAVQKGPTSSTAYFYLGRAKVNLGDYDGAESALRQTITIGGDEAVEAHRYLGAVYIEKHDTVRAADELESYLKLAPTAKDAERIRTIIKDLRSQASTKPR